MQGLASPAHHPVKLGDEQCILQMVLEARKPESSLRAECLFWLPFYAWTTTAVFISDLND